MYKLRLFAENSSQNSRMWLIYGNVWSWSSLRKKKLLKMSLNYKHIINWKHIVVDHCLPNGAVDIFKCLFGILVLQEFFQVSFTLLAQLNTNLQGISILPQSCLPWGLQPVTSMCTFLPCACEKIPRYLQICARQMVNFFIVFCHLFGKFIHWIIKLLLCEVSLQLWVSRFDEWSFTI